MQNRILPTGKRLSINTQNLEFPEIGRIVELYADEAIVKLANGTLTYSYFTSVERDAIAKLAVKLQVGSLVHVAVQHDEVKKEIVMQDQDMPVSMRPIRIQEVQPVYPEKGSIVEVGSSYVKIKLEKTGAVETVLFSAAEIQLVQESNISFAMDQVVNVSVRKVAVNGRAIDIQEIGSPEPVTVFFISPKSAVPPAPGYSPASDPRTVFTFLQTINSPVAVKKRESIVLNPTRTLVLEQIPSVAAKPSQDQLPAIDKLTEDKKKKLLRRKPLVNPGNLLANGVNASVASSSVVSHLQKVAPRVQTPNITRDSSPAVSAEPKSALSVRPKTSSLFPAISVMGVSSSSKPVTKPVDNTADYHNELHDVLNSAIHQLKFEATNKKHVMLMKNLSFITLSKMLVSNKLQLIIAEVKKHNSPSYSIPGIYVPSRNMIPASVIDAFVKLVAGINLEYRDEKRLSQLKLLLPAQPSVDMFPASQKAKTLRRY